MSQAGCGGAPLAGFAVEPGQPGGNQGASLTV